MTRSLAGFMKIVGAALLAVGVQHVPTDAPIVFAQQPAAQAPAPAQGRGGRGPAPVDPRVQMREYLFEETNEKLPYAVFVSSKVRRDTKAPLVIALHGLGGTPTSLLRGNALDLSEAGGYILVGPMGYNPRGWYGSPVIATGRGRGADSNDPPNLSELSEKDVLKVLDLVRSEFSVDERRTYLMGHSMGGAGTFHLAVKYPQTWAAAAAIAPAAFRLNPSSLQAIPAMPMVLIHGDADTVVPISVSRPWAEQMKQLKMTHVYTEVPGGDHGSVISTGMPDIFAFFEKHSKPASAAASAVAAPNAARVGGATGR